MAQINKATDHFNTVTFTGDDTADRAITVGFRPDLTWQKSRNVSANFVLIDQVRGATKVISSDTTAAEDTVNTGNGIVATSTGIEVSEASDWSSINRSGRDIVSWNWKAGGTAVSNTDGSITSSVSANQTAGFSIVSYLGTGVAATIGHGLGAVPKMIMCKKRDGVAYDWSIYHYANGATQTMQFTSAYPAGNGSWNSTNPTSSVFSVGTVSDTNTNQNYIAYCFADVKGYQKIGYYYGNNSSDGTFVYTGFKPAFIMTKDLTAADHWTLWDNKREHNPNNNVVFPSTNVVESTTDATYYCDILSNGFKWRGNSTGMNGSNTYAYYAVAAEPLVGTNNIPATAR